MKKVKKFLFTMTGLVLIAGTSCKNELGADNPVSSKSELSVNINGNFVLDSTNEEIPFSNFVEVPGGVVISSPDYTFYKTYAYQGSFSATGRNLEIPAFQLGTYEVTQRLYKAVMEGDVNAVSEPSYCKNLSNTVKSRTYIYSDANEEENDLRPVEGITWYDAVYFCNRLSKKTGKVPFYEINSIKWLSKHIVSAVVSESTAKGHNSGYRLPRRAEWEYAARGANPSSEQTSNWMQFFAGKASSNTSYVNKDIDSVGWYWCNSANAGITPDSLNVPSSGSKGYSTHRVGLKDANSLGLKDMSGNVNEWCWDYYGLVSADTPLDGPAPHNYERVISGGSWHNGANDCCVALDSSLKPDEFSDEVGFRIAFSVE